MRDKKRKRVLILMDMPLFPYRIYAYNELAERGYDLTVVSIETGKADFPVRKDFEHIALRKKTYGGFVKVPGLTSVDYNAYEVIVLALNMRYVDFYPLLFGKLHNRVIGWGHMKGQTSGNALSQWLRKRVAGIIPALIFYDYQTREEYIREGFPMEKLFVANNTQYVDPTTVDMTRKREYFLYVGRIQERKGIDLAIQAFAQLVKNEASGNTSFKIVGGGEKAVLEQMVKDLGVSGFVEFVGPVHDEKKLGELYSGALAYVSPGHVGLGVLHSFAFGVPVLTCKDRKHSVEYNNCSEENSYLTYYDVENVAKAMMEVLQDKAKWQTKSKNAYEYYNNYCTIEKMVDGIDEALKHLLKKLEAGSAAENLKNTPPHYVRFSDEWLRVNGYSGGYSYCGLKEWRAAA